MHRHTVRALLGTPQHPELVFRRTYSAPAADVMEACTRIDRLARWFGTVAGEPRAVGDPFTAQLSEDPSDLAHGRVLACETDTISVSWRWQAEPESIVTARVLRLDPDRSELVLSHRLAQPDHAPGYGGGWELILRSLARSLGAPDDAETSDAQLESSAAEAWRVMTEHPLSLEQRVSAPVEQTWQAIATAEGLRRWWWSHWNDVQIDAEVRVGGSYRFSAPAAGIALEGTYLHVEEPHRLAFTWRWTDSDGTSTDEAVDIRLAPVDGTEVAAGSDAATTVGTRIQLTHTGPWADAAPARSYRQGWEFTLAQLHESFAAEG